MDKKFYAAITPDVVAIFDTWWQAKQLTNGIAKSKCKSFPTHDKAVGFIKATLSDDDWHDFCFDRCPLYLNKKFVRLNNYIALKERKKHTKETQWI